MKFATNAKSVRQNYDESQIMTKNIRLISDEIQTQTRGFAPEKLWQLLQSQESPHMTKEVQEEFSEGISDIEKLLVDSDEQNINNTKLYKALVLALV